MKKMHCHMVFINFIIIDLKFLAFIKQITEKNYFKGCDESSKEYQDRYNKAREKYLSSLESKSKQAEDFKNKGNDFVSEKKYQEAIDCYNNAIKLNDQNPLYYSNL
jgi:small glutamine-rich tetratricopeptide repeat-containing protein alpha